MFINFEHYKKIFVIIADHCDCVIYHKHFVFINILNLQEKMKIF